MTNVVWFDDFFFEFRKRKFFIIFCFSSRRSSRPSSRESSQRSDRSVSFSKDLKTTKSAAGTAAHKSSKKSEEMPPKKSKKERKRPDSRSSRSSSHSRSPTPKRERKKKKRHHHRKRKSDGKIIHFHNSLLHDPVYKVILQKKYLYLKMKKMEKVDHGKEAKVNRKNPKRNIAAKTIQEKNLIPNVKAVAAKKSTGVHDVRALHLGENLRKKEILLLKEFRNSLI